MTDSTDYLGLAIEDVKKVTDEVVKGLKQLPSAQPSVSKTEIVEDVISRQAAIKTGHLPVMDDAGYEVVRVDDILALPSTQIDCTDCIKNGGDWECDHKHCHKGKPTQSELEKKILEIGYTGKEGRIYIGGRLFAVRELPQ